MPPGCSGRAGIRPRGSTRVSGRASEDEAEDACRRLVTTLALALPAGGIILDAGNGLGTQEPVIAEVASPRRLVAVNITEWQLVAGRSRLNEAAAAAVAG